MADIWGVEGTRKSIAQEKRAMYTDTPYMILERIENFVFCLQLFGNVMSVFYRAWHLD